MYLNLEKEMLSDGSHVYNIIVIEKDSEKKGEYKTVLQFNCVDKRSALDLITALRTKTVDIEGDNLDTFVD
jgi:hypothetical protein